MRIDLNNLPSGDEFTHQIIIDLMNEVVSLKDQNLSLQEQLALLKKQRFGQSSEKLDNQIAELEAKIEEGELLEAASTPKQSDALTEKPKNIPKRQKLPEHLERIDEILNPDPICPDCGGESFRKIADDISEILEYIPSSFKVIRHIRPRCACINCEKIVQAYPASKPIAKGMAGPGLLAHILVQKYCNHLPFYRQSEIWQAGSDNAPPCYNHLLKKSEGLFLLQVIFMVMIRRLKSWRLGLARRILEGSGLTLEMVENMVIKLLQQFVIFIVPIAKASVLKSI